LDDFAINVKNISKTFTIKKQKGFTNLIKKTKEKDNGKTEIHALNEISFTVKKGEILGIIGLNASGKTTLLRTIAGVYLPDSGSIQVNGILSPLMQLGAGFQPELDARENIIINGLLLGLLKKEIENKVEKILEFAELEKFSQLKLKYFSSGMKARLAFSTAMQINPDILLVDEILSVGDKDFQKKSYETFISLAKNKKTVIHASHNLAKISEFSDRILLLHKGRKVMLGKPDEVINKYKTLKSSN